ncbi:hypothetical protein RND81_02G226300 [Saponaria officinalis]|uniref:Uncharacterized protein n=1 Tax=Saponaria officinalis TaxID=3572 RepID=A0AAW1MZN3_SAPOF
MASEQANHLQRQVVATLGNQAPSEIYCERYMNWSDRPGPLPHPIPAGGVIDYFDFGLWGAVLYNERRVTCQQKGWLLAWDAREITIGGSYKVYVTCGTKSEIDNLTEAEIKKSLGESFAESTAADVESRTTANAIIKSLEHNVIPAVASIIANFGVIA